MKKILYLFICLSAAFAGYANSPVNPNPHIDVYKIDVNASTIEWIGEKVSGTHNGTIKLMSGQLQHNHGKFNGVFTIDMNTIEVTDLTGDRKAKLEKHLKSDDFFGVDSFPTAAYELLSLSPLSGVEPGKPNFMVSGKLTIKGITQDFSFPALIRFEGPSMTATGEMKVDRSKFNVTYRSKTFFEDVGDKVIYDEFVLKLNIKAEKH